MSLLSGWEGDLHEFRIQAVKLVPQDYGRPPTVEPQSEVEDISGQEQSTKEAIAAGVEAGRVFMRLYSGPDLDPNITEKHTLRMWSADGTSMGDWNLRSRREFRGEHIELEADKLNTQ